mmetsp:Transcript_92668/g.276361  ORF Transcript_92668/g.276361 Transcript_92668/m.276361 type:complete len:315 (+) Transcript_92668:52-996(+)
MGPAARPGRALAAAAVALAATATAATEVPLPGVQGRDVAAAIPRPGADCSPLEADQDPEEQCVSLLHAGAVALRNRASAQRAVSTTAPLPVQGRMANEAVPGSALGPAAPAAERAAEPPRAKASEARASSESRPPGTSQGAGPEASHGAVAAEGAAAPLSRQGSGQREAVGATLSTLSPQAVAATDGSPGIIAGAVLQEASERHSKAGARSSGFSPAAGGFILVILGLAMACVSIVFQHRWEELELNEANPTGDDHEEARHRFNINKASVRRTVPGGVAAMWSSLHSRTAESSRHGDPGGFGRTASGSAVTGCC